MHSHDAAFAWLGGEVGELGEARVLVGQADEAKTDMALSVVQIFRRRGTDRHAEALTLLATDVHAIADLPAGRP